VAAASGVELLAQAQDEPASRRLRLLLQELGEPREQHPVVAHAGEPPPGVAQPPVLALVDGFVQRPQEAQAARARFRSLRASCTASSSRRDCRSVLRARAM
jgi:DNA polymerase IIIc chi subunit